MKKTIAKFDWLTAEQCSTMAWRGLRSGSKALDEAGLFRMEQGQEIGAFARKLYPNGIFVSRAAGKTGADQTQELIADSNNETLFEATFLAVPFVAKADILTRQNGAWHVLEVKSSLSDPKKLKELVDDLA